MEHLPQPLELPPDTPDEKESQKTHESDSLASIREKVEHLSNSEKLDKESALQMMRLFHAMELLFHQEVTARDASIAALRHEVHENRMRTEVDRIATRQIQETIPTSTRTRRR